MIFRRSRIIFPLPQAVQLAGAVSHPQAMAARGRESKDEADTELYPLYLSISLLQGPRS